MFARGADEGRVLTWCYDEKDEDFTKGSLDCGPRTGPLLHCVKQSFKMFWARLKYLTDATSLDTWVLDTLTDLFRNATSDLDLDAQLRAPGIVFFLHLLGLDTTGHAYRPHSKARLHITSARTKENQTDIFQI
jgi:phosphatidylinositol glycan class N